MNSCSTPVLCAQAMPASNLRDRSRDPRQDRGIGSATPSARATAGMSPVSSCRSDHRPCLGGLTPPCRRRASRITGDAGPAVPISAHGREIEARDVIHHGTRQRRYGCVHQNTATASRRSPAAIRSRPSQFRQGMKRFRLQVSWTQVQIRGRLRNPRRLSSG